MPAKLLIILFSLYPFLLTAQPFSTKPENVLAISTGSQLMQPVSSLQALHQIETKASWRGQYIWLARFTALPSGSQKLQWQKEGTEMLSKIDAQTYFVRTTVAPTAQWLQQHAISHTAICEPKLKLHKSIASNVFPADAKDGAGRLVALVSVHSNLSLSDIKQWLVQNNFEIDSTVFENGGHVLTVHIPFKQLLPLAEMPFTVYIQPIQKDVLLNEKARFFSGAFMANARLSSRGHNLNGKGVVVGVGDDGDGSIHPDLAGRVTTTTGGGINSHGAHVSGTIAGAGLLQPDRRGMAPMATIINQVTSSIWRNGKQNFEELGMVLTNNSYGASVFCEQMGQYNLFSQMLDQQPFDLPVILNVFAAGNSGEQVCGVYPDHYGTVLGTFQSAKNVITVGNLDYNQLVSSPSSCGPVNDGRIKPEIMSLGALQSTNANAGYEMFYGTSMAAPGITGGLALLYERYRQLFAGQNPQGALMKAILLNGARDIGTKGPDYKHGYGIMHLENSLRMLDSHYYLTGDITTGAAQDTIVTVPQGVAQFKVMLYWHDPAASPIAATSLVNDLDLEVIMPDGTTIVYPKKLNPSPLNVADPATEGTDHINNSEQVVIEAPMAGNYTIRIKGYDVTATGSQVYHACFDYVPKGLTIRTPVAGDSWSVVDPTETSIRGVAISWDDEGTPTHGTYMLEYSLDAGNNWTTIPADTLNPAIPLVLKDTCRYFGWRPQVATNSSRAMVRITKNGTDFSTTSGIFSILNRPTGVLVTKSCEGYLSVSWKPVIGADDYEVIMKQGLQMVPIAVVDSPYNYVIKGLSKDSTYYVAVRARKGGLPGRYMYANGYVPNAGACAANISDGDLKLDSIVSPISARQFTSNALGTSQNILIRVKNLDNTAVPAGSYTIQYSLDNAPFISQPGGAIKALGTYTGTFTGHDFSAIGPHVLTAVVTNISAKDEVPKNDTFTTVVKNLPNPLIVPTTDTATSFLEDFETATDDVYQRSTVGLSGLDRWDYFKSSIYDRARTYVRNRPTFSGVRAFNMDITRSQIGVSNNQLQGTFNLSASLPNDEVRVQFQYRGPNEYSENGDKNSVWVRGNDQAAWLYAKGVIASGQELEYDWKKSKSIELTDLLAAANPPQALSAATQIRFGISATGQIEGGRGASFDDIRIYLATNDMQMLAVDVPSILTCSDPGLLPIKIKVRNSMSYPINGVIVSYVINYGDTVFETIPVPVSPNTDFEYTFNKQQFFPFDSNYLITAAVNYPGDNVPENNAVTQIVHGNSPIKRFPYMAFFDSDEEGFKASGKASSWERGKPEGVKIGAAASGSEVWKTSLKGHYNDSELSYLTSPCFNMGKLANPTLSFSFAYDLGDCDTPPQSCDSAWMEYSTDGVNWQKLGAVGQGTNWYDNKNNTWSKQGHSHWHVATIPLPKSTSIFSFRFVMAANESNNYEGLAIDGIHIYDLPMPMYTQIGESEAVVHPVSGDSSVDFSVGGKLIATIYPWGNDLGNTEVKAYIFDGPLRNYNGSQYYGNRNITIKPTTRNLQNAVGVRLYFSDKEIDSLRLANSCANCTQLKDYTHLGITKYTDPEKMYEDGTLDNNINGIHQFYPSNEMWLMPYDSGYMAELYITDFSEFWLNDGRGENLPLPNNYIDLKVAKQNSVNGKLEWNTVSETDIDFYEIQSATDQQAFNTSIFTNLGKIFARNNGPAVYSYFDQRTGKTGNYYYRIKQVAKNGHIIYSPVRLLSFGKSQFDITLHPNPVKDNLWMAVQSDENKLLHVKIINMMGQVIYLQNWSVLKGRSQLSVPLGKLGIGEGVYSVGVGDGKSWWYGKVLKK